MESEFSLPRQSIQKLIKKSMPPNTKYSAGELVDLVSEVALKYIRVLADESNNSCTDKGNKTIKPDHVYLALKNLNFAQRIEELQSVADEVNQVKIVSTTQNKKNKKNLIQKQGLSIEELQREQERLFADAQTTFGTTVVTGSLQNDEEEYD